MPYKREKALYVASSWHSNYLRMLNFKYRGTQKKIKVDDNFKMTFSIKSVTVSGKTKALFAKIGDGVLHINLETGRVAKILK